MKDAKGQDVEIGSRWIDDDPRARRGELPKRTLQVQSFRAAFHGFQAVMYCEETGFRSGVAVKRLNKRGGYLPAPEAK